MRNIFKYVAIKAHYLFRQSIKINTLTVSKHDWKYYEKYNEINITQFKTIEYKIYRNKTFDYNKDSYFKDIDCIIFYVGYRILKKTSEVQEENKTTSAPKTVEIYMLLIDQMLLDMNNIFIDSVSFDFTSNSNFKDFIVLSKEDLNKMLKTINRDIPKEFKYRLHYKLIENEYFENPHYLLYTQFIPAQGVKHQLRHLV